MNIENGPVIVFGIMFALATLITTISFPLAAIWAVNILFETEIPYTMCTWFAAFILLGFIFIAIFTHRS